MTNRFKLFTAARAISGVSVEEFAGKLGVSRQHVFLTLKNPTRSKSLTKALDTFIARYIPDASLIQAKRRRAA